MESTIALLGRKLLELAYQWSDGSSATLSDLHAVAQTVVLLAPAGDHADRMRRVVAAVEAVRDESARAAHAAGDEDTGASVDRAEDLLREALKAAVAPFLIAADCPHCGAFERQCAIDDPRKGRFCMRTGELF